MSFRSPLLTVAIALFGLVSQASADIIVEYEPLDNSKANPSLPGSNVNPFVSADNMAAGSGLTGYKVGGWKWRDFDPASTSFADAVTANDTWTWGFDITSDVQIKLNNLQFRLDRNLAGPDDFEIQMTINGSNAQTVFSHDFAGDAAPTNFNVDLSPFSKYQKQGDSIEFTFAGFNSTTSSGFLILQPFDGAVGLRLDGNVSVPEPATMGALAAITGVVLVGRRRRRKAQAEKETELAA